MVKGVVVFKAIAVSIQTSWLAAYTSRNRELADEFVSKSGYTINNIKTYSFIL